MDKDKKPGGSKPCPICGKTAVDRHGPFCSARCADIDLGRWFREGYRIPSNEPAPDLSEPPPPDEIGDGRHEH